MSRRAAAATFHFQRGAAVIVMLVIMVVGALTFLVISLSPASIRLKQQDTTAQALAQAKDALIGRAVKDANLPGSLPCPDTNDDGSSEMLAGNHCPSYIGRLPWRTLGLPDLRDGSGERLWYVLSRNFRDDNSNPINSDTLGDLTVGGTTAVSDVTAIVFAPSGALVNQSRSATQTALCSTTNTTIPENLCAANFLEGSNANLNTLASPNLSFQTAIASDSFNDHPILITHDQLFQPVEIRIAREARACLDSYAASSGNKYPWASPSTSTAYTGQQDYLFGRISGTPSIDISGASSPLGPGNDPNYASVDLALSNLSIAITNCAASDSAANIAALSNAALVLDSIVSALPDPPYTTTFTNSASTLISLATSSNACWKIENNHNPAFISDINSSLSTTLTSLSGLTTSSTAAGMSATWPDGCFGSAVGTGMNQYWNNWRSFVFYQVDDLYKPSNTVLSAPFPTPTISINGTGTYRAAIVVARKVMPSILRNETDASTYLETINQHQNAPTSPSTSFQTYSPSDIANYATQNDLVLCLDGSNNCK